MDDDCAELDRPRSAYKAAVDAWIKAIRAEQELASVPHTVSNRDASRGG